MSTHPPILGLQEIASTLDVARRTPHAWKFREKQAGRGANLPPADYESVNGLPAWNWDTICAWASSSGRLPERYRAEASQRGFTVVPSVTSPVADKIAAFTTNYGLLGLEVPTYLDRHGDAEEPEMAEATA